jgi:hypothetical protein
VRRTDVKAFAEEKRLAAFGSETDEATRDTDDGESFVTNDIFVERCYLFERSSRIGEDPTT